MDHYIAKSAEEIDSGHLHIMIALGSLYIAGKLDEGLDSCTTFESLDRLSRASASFAALTELPGMEGSRANLDWGYNYEYYKLLEFSILRDVLGFRYKPLLAHTPAKLAISLAAFATGLGI